MYFLNSYCTFLSRQAVYCTVILIARLRPLLNFTTISVGWRSEGFWSRWRPFLASYSVGWRPLSSLNVIPDIFWSNFKSGYFIGLLTGHFCCQESLEIWSLSLAVRSRSFYRRTGTEGAIREERKSDAAKGDVASSSSLYTNTDRFLLFS